MTLDGQPEKNPCLQKVRQLFKFLNWIWNNGCISGLNYNLEKQEEPSVSIDLEATIASMDTMEFCLVRENS
jgi:hypothetical protein